MNQLAICVPTYHQPKRIQEMMVRCIKIYELLNVDVYFYDSSSDTKTELIILKNQKKYSNIYYRHFPEYTHSNIKVLEAYKEIISIFLAVSGLYTIDSQRDRVCLKLLCKGI